MSSSRRPLTGSVSTREIAELRLGPYVLDACVCVTVVWCVYPAVADQTEKMQNLLHKPTDT